MGILCVCERERGGDSKVEPKSAFSCFPTIPEVVGDAGGDADREREEEKKRGKKEKDHVQNLVMGFSGVPREGRKRGKGCVCVCVFCTFTPSSSPHHVRSRWMTDVEVRNAVGSWTWRANEGFWHDM
jgi:hypothetical protein